MRRSLFGPGFINDLGAILRSESMAERYDSHSGKLADRVLVPFTREWTLDSLELVSGTEVIARFSGEGHEVIATISASDFDGPTWKRDRVRNSSPYSAFAVQMSELIEEKILIHSPSELEAHEVRIRP
jgi:hypothetical protein